MADEGALGRAEPGSGPVGWLEPAGWLDPDGWAPDDPSSPAFDRLDSLVMDARDRIANLGLFAAAGVVWILVALVLTARDPRIDPTAGFVGAVLIGLAVGLTVVPLFWLAVFARHRRIAYRGDWTRALRRGGWVAIVTAVFVILRLQQLFVPPLALFILALVVLAETVLSVER
jgi:hypothetical protein